MVGKLGIDVAVSERDVMARQVLGFLNTGPVISKTMLPGGTVGVFEIEVLQGAPVTEHVLANVPLPTQCLIAAVMRQDYVRVPGADDRLQPEDVVIALVDEAVVDETVALFTANGR